MGDMLALGAELLLLLYLLKFSREDQKFPKVSGQGDSFPKNSVWF